MSRLKRQYYWTAIPHSPFTLVITYPEPYGLNRVQIRYEDEIHRIVTKGTDVLNFFEGSRWKIHPDWWVWVDDFLSRNTQLFFFWKNLIWMNRLNFVHVFRLYCKHADIPFDSPEEELKYFLNRTKINYRWKWKGRTVVSPEHAVHCK